MPFKIVRNDITKMNTDAIVNTANCNPCVGPGCDYAIYMAAGFDKLLNYRKEKIGSVNEGEAFITPAFDLPSKYIIHAVSPLFMDGKSGEEEKLRSCYQNSLKLAKENDIKSIAFPLISTGGFGYPKEMGMRIAVDEINAFLFSSEMQIYLVVFDKKSTGLGERIFPELDKYIDQNYVDFVKKQEYSNPFRSPRGRENSSSSTMERIRESGLTPGGHGPLNCSVSAPMPMPMAGSVYPKVPGNHLDTPNKGFTSDTEKKKNKGFRLPSVLKISEKKSSSYEEELIEEDYVEEYCAEEVEKLQSKLDERMAHLSDTFTQYLLFLIQSKGMENADVYNRAIVDKKVFSKIKNNPDYHPKKLTALCLCVGAKLNMDETRDLLARAGYALSPCDKQDIIFSYFIENEIYDMIELDIQLEEHGLPCIIE